MAGGRLVTSCSSFAGAGSQCNSGASATHRHPDPMMVRRLTKTAMNMMTTTTMTTTGKMMMIMKTAMMMVIKTGMTAMMTYDTI